MCSEFGVPWVACTGKGYDSMERALRILPWANVFLGSALVVARLT